MFSSIDPAPPSKQKDVVTLKRELVDVEANLFDRYKAMFSLRNLANEEAVLVCFFVFVFVFFLFFCFVLFFFVCCFIIIFYYRFIYYYYYYLVLF